MTKRCFYPSGPIFLTIFITFLIALLPACTTVQVNPDTVGSYELGELRVMAEADIDAVYLAAKGAIEDDQLFLTGDTWSGTTATLTARDEVDNRITIKLKQMEPRVTSVRIRYGLTGDLHYAQNLYTLMEKRL